MTFIINHALVKDKLTKIRCKQTAHHEFRSGLKEITTLMAYEVTKNFAVKKIQIQTPLASTVGYELKDPIVLIPILRAGLGMVEGLVDIIHTSYVGHIGIYRNEKTAQPNNYYHKLPKITKNANVIILDPMLATGGSISEAITITKKHQPKSISLICLVAAPQGLTKIEKSYPDVNIYTCAIDQKLNENKFIVPGLGDAGDRIFGTK